VIESPIRKGGCQPRMSTQKRATSAYKGRKYSGNFYAEKAMTKLTGEIGEAVVSLI